MSPTTRKIMLISIDGESIEVDEVVALKSETIKNMIKDALVDSAVSLPITSKILKKIIQYCEKHVETGPESADVIVNKIIEYCEKHAETGPESTDIDPESTDPDPESIPTDPTWDDKLKLRPWDPEFEELKAWDAEFVKVDKDTLIDLLLDGKYLGIWRLECLIVDTIADRIKGMTPEEMKLFFNIKEETLPSTTKKITLISSDGVTFEVDEVVALKSETIKDLIKVGCAEDGCPDSGILLSEVSSKILEKVIEYCKKRVETDPESTDTDCTYDDKLKAWDAEFVKVDKDILIDLLLAAKYLNIRGLLSLTCDTIADRMKEMTPEEMQKFLNIKNVAQLQD